jgi:hypothetical protein
VQLTSNRVREDAHRFYESLGFTPSHVGYKLALDHRSTDHPGASTPHQQAPRPLD